MVRFFLASILSLTLSASAYGLTLQISCPYPNAKYFYKNQYVYVETVVEGTSNVKPIKGTFKLADDYGVIKLPNKYAKTGLLVRVSLSAPAFPPKKTAIPGCTTVPVQLKKGDNTTNFSGSGLTEDCGIVNVKSVCKHSE